MSQTGHQLLTARGITVDTRGARLLHGVDFTARSGEVTAIVGPSGAGKSTLLKVLSGDQRYGGSARLNGHEIRRTSLPRQAAMRAVLAQATPLAFPFSVLEVVRLGAGRRDAAADLAQRALSHVGLAGFEARQFQELSGGEQQRVQLARVLSQVWEPVSAEGPRWLLLDEPVSSLDIGHQLQVMEILADFARRGGGVVAVMHDLNLTAMTAASVALVQDGRLLAQGSPAQVYHSPHLSRAYGCDLAVGAVPQGTPFVLPQTAVRPG